MELEKYKTSGKIHRNSLYNAMIGLDVLGVTAGTKEGTVTIDVAAINEADIPGYVTAYLRERIDEACGFIPSHHSVRRALIQIAKETDNEVE